MALPIFKSFWPAIAALWRPSSWRQEYKIITDNNTGAPIGLLSMNANGPDGIWAPTPLSSDQILAPSAAMVADLNATFQLNVAPYSRYRSDGIQLVPMDSESGTVIPPGINEIFFSPLVVTEAGGPLIIEGGARVIE